LHFLPACCMFTPITGGETLLIDAICVVATDSSLTKQQRNNLLHFIQLLLKEVEIDGHILPSLLSPTEVLKWLVAPSIGSEVEERGVSRELGLELLNIVLQEQNTDEWEDHLHPLYICMKQLLNDYQDLWKMGSSVAERTLVLELLEKLGMLIKQSPQCSLIELPDFMLGTDVKDEEFPVYVLLKMVAFSADNLKLAISQITELSLLLDSYPRLLAALYMVLPNSVLPEWRRIARFILALYQTEDEITGQRTALVSLCKILTDLTGLVSATHPLSCMAHLLNCLNTVIHEMWEESSWQLIDVFRQFCFLLSRVPEELYEVGGVLLLELVGSSDRTSVMDLEQIIEDILPETPLTDHLRKKIAIVTNVEE